MTEHLPVLQVILPLLSAPLCVVIRHRGAIRLLTLAVSWVSLAISGTLLAHVHQHGPISYELGGWAPPWGIEYRVDALNAYILLIVNMIAAIVLPYAPKSLAREVPRHKQHLFMATFMLCLSGLLGIAITGDIFNIFVFLEISSLSSYVLISMGQGRRALTAAYQYLIMGTIGGTFFLIGIGLLYMMTGTLNIADMASRIDEVMATRTVMAAFAFLTVGVCIKLALFPLHAWLPNAYTFAPSMITAFLAATATKVSFYLLLRILFTVFGLHYAFSTMHIGRVLLPIALLAIFIASTVAIYQTNVKRLLAYSSLAQVGYMVLGLSLAHVTDGAGLTAAILHLFNHALMKGGLFLALGCVFFSIGSVHLKDMRGIGRTMPWTMAAFVIGGLNLIGVPFTCGFISKWYLLLAALEVDALWLAALILISSLLAAIYIWKVIEVAYFQEPDDPTRREAPLGMLLPVWIMMLASIVFGFYTRLPLGAAQRAAEFLLGGPA